LFMVMNQGSGQRIGQRNICLGEEVLGSGDSGLKMGG
jgi:hypothetical protein